MKNGGIDVPPFPYVSQTAMSLFIHVDIHLALEILIKEFHLPAIFLDNV
jgi:hypothetical protein